MEWKKEEIAEKGIHPLHIPWRPRGTAQRKMETARQKAPGQPKDQRRPTKQTCPSNFPFDLKADVGEQNNLAGDKPGMVKKLRARMEALDAEITQNARQPWFKN